ncbi:MAG: threonine-phosphate decarboxylase CobD [Oscillospiraceae bacterium]|jgi:threonine-phosphate decarboxylase|nr:threonine-phosphate decarboxylase CobD [Oscillospiraceae bacterium]
MTGNITPVTAHGGDILTYALAHGGKTPLDFSANINPLGMPASVKAAAIAAVDDCAAYPDPHCRMLRDALSRAEGLPREWFFCGNGAADVIFRLAVALKPRAALVTAPTFSEYEGSLNAVGCEVRRHALLERDGFRVTDAILGAADGADAVYVCNPNNPTGVLTPPELLLRLAERCAKSGAYLIVDECFNDFIDAPEEYSVRRHLAAHSNIVILRSFTKLYAMPGVRLGYCACADAGLMRRLYDAGPPWAVSGIAQACGIAALGEREFARESREYVARERSRLSDGLKALGFTVFDGAANYLLIISALKTDLAAELAARGILIRTCGNYAGLDGTFYRAAVRSTEDNDALLKALKDITEGK